MPAGHILGFFMMAVGALLATGKASAAANDVVIDCSLPSSCGAAPKQVANASEMKAEPKAAKKSCGYKGCPKPPKPPVTQGPGTVVTPDPTKPSDQAGTPSKPPVSGSQGPGTVVTPDPTKPSDQAGTPSKPPVSGSQGPGTVVTPDPTKPSDQAGTPSKPPVSGSQGPGAVVTPDPTKPSDQAGTPSKPPKPPVTQGPSTVVTPDPTKPSDQAGTPSKPPKPPTPDCCCGKVVVTNSVTVNLATRATEVKSGANGPPPALTGGDGLCSPSGG